MRNKIKRMAYAASVVGLTVPGLVMAQFQAPNNTNLPSGTVYGIIENVMKWILGLVGILGVIGFAIAGILYLTAAGDEGRINTAKTAMIYSIIGVVVALLGLVILNAARAMLSGSTNQF